MHQGGAVPVSNFRRYTPRGQFLRRAVPRHEQMGAVCRVPPCISQPGLGAHSPGGFCLGPSGATHASVHACRDGERGAARSKRPASCADGSDCLAGDHGATIVSGGRWGRTLRENLALDDEPSEARRGVCHATPGKRTCFGFPKGHACLHHRETLRLYGSLAEVSAEPTERRHVSLKAAFLNVEPGPRAAQQA